MTDWDPNNLDPYEKANWVLRNYWWAMIPSVVGFVVLLEVAQDRWGNTGFAMVQVGLLVFVLGAFLYDRRAKQKKAERERQ